MARLILTADGSRMRRARETAGLTVGQLVERLREEGIDRHPDSIRNVELGHQQPGLEVLDAYARIVGVNRADLLADDAKEIA